MVFGIYTWGFFVTAVCMWKRNRRCSNFEGTYDSPQAYMRNSVLEEAVCFECSNNLRSFWTWIEFSSGWSHPKTIILLTRGSVLYGMWLHPWWPGYTVVFFVLFSKRIVIVLDPLNPFSKLVSLWLTCAWMYEEHVLKKQCHIHVELFLISLIRKLNFSNVRPKCDRMQRSCACTWKLWQRTSKITCRTYRN